MATANDYDAEIQMFVQGPREIELAHLRFLRWLAVRGSLEHAPAGRPHGLYALREVPIARPDSLQPSGAPARPGARPE